MTPLAGRRILITRPRAQAADLCARLAALGAEPIVFPTIEITPLEDTALLDRAIDQLSTYHWIIFTSRSGVEAVFRRTRSIAGPKVAAIGPATATTLRARGVEPDLVPAEYLAEAILEALGEVRGLRFLLPRADIAREALVDGLEHRGAVVHEIAAYRTTELSVRRADLGPVDAVTFTSSSTVRGFLAGGPVPDGAKVVCIGPITAQTAREHGLDVAAVAEHYTEDGLIAALGAAFARR